MSRPFTNADSSPYKPGSLFLGYSDSGKEIGIKSEKHFLTIAASGSGKGAGLIIPNLKRWPDNILVIDPGGGNARATWDAREAMGQEVHIIDPTGVSLVGDKRHGPVPERLLKTFNPIGNLKPESLTYGEELGVIADGCVMRHDPKHASWDNAGADLIAGVIDFLVRTFPPSDHTLPEARKFLIGSPEVLKETFEKMAACPGPTARAAATIGLADLVKPNGYIGNAQANTKWLDYTSIGHILGSSTCELSDLKTKACTIYLCIDPDFMEEHGRFLRMFVRSAVAAMAKGGENGRNCLFILDEFFSLGKIDYLKKAAATMRKNGVQLWPILQYLSQLSDLYGEDGKEAFFGGADAQIFFGSTDVPTINHISERIGPYRGADIGPAPVHLNAQLPGGIGAPFINESIEDYQKRRDANNKLADEIMRFNLQGAIDGARYSELRGQVGQPLVPPQIVREIIGKKDGDPVARSMIVFGKGSDIFNLRPGPYFLPPPAPIEPEPPALDPAPAPDAAPAMAAPRPFNATPARTGATVGGGFLGLCLAALAMPDSVPGLVFVAVLALGAMAGFLGGMKLDDAAHAKEGRG